MISFRTALLLFGALIGIAFATLKGQALYLALLIIGALLAKSALHEYKGRL